MPSTSSTGVVRRYRSHGLRTSQWRAIVTMACIILLCIAAFIPDTGTDDARYLGIPLGLWAAYKLHETIRDAYSWFQIEDLGDRWRFTSGAWKRTRAVHEVSHTNIGTAHSMLTEDVHNTGDGSHHVRVVLKAPMFARDGKEYHLGERFHLSQRELDEICGLINATRVNGGV